MEQLLYHPEPKPLDTKWFPRYLRNSFDVLELFEGLATQRQEQRKAFLAAEKENPFFDYPKVELSAVFAKLANLGRLGKEIMLGEKHPGVKSAYKSAIDERFTAASFLVATDTQQWSRFNQLSALLFGSPSPDIWEYTLDLVRQEAKAANSPTARKLRAMIPEAHRTDIPNFMPNPSTQRFVHQLVLKQLGTLPELPPGETFDGAMIKQIVTGHFKAMGAKGWRAVDSPRSNISVNQLEQLFKVPPGRIMSRREFNGLISGHEEFHIERGINGRQSKLILLGLGLPGYEGAEEGLATIRESVVNGFIDDAKWIGRFLTCGLLLGMDGQPRNFRETFEIIETYFRFKKETGRLSTKSPEDEAYETVERGTRGTDGQQQGIANTKDHFYWQNYLLVWQFLKDNPQEIYRTLRGKYNPMDPTHLDIMDQLGYTLDKFVPS